MEAKNLGPCNCCCSNQEHRCPCNKSDCHCCNANRENSCSKEYPCSCNKCDCHCNKHPNHMFEEFMKDFGNTGKMFPMLCKNNFENNLKVSPRMDISDTEKEYIIDADLPGVKEEDVNVSVSKDGVLTIKGKRESKEEQSKRNYYKMERSYGSFERVLTLPENCDYDKVEATFKDGILSVKVHKKMPANGDVRQIKISHK